MRRSRTSVYLWFLTLAGFRRRTPGPPPFSSMNSTPANSIASFENAGAVTGVAAPHRMGAALKPQ